MWRARRSRRPAAATTSSFSTAPASRSPGYATLFWLGDQLQTWDEYDGIKTALVGVLSSGISGYSLVHSDTGGYNALKLKVGDVTVPVIARTPELFMRWMELNAFTAVLRTHEGLDPAIAAQFDTNADTAAHLRRFGLIFKALAPYRKPLIASGSRGPACRSCATPSCTIPATPTRSPCATSSCSGRT